MSAGNAASRAGGPGRSGLRVWLIVTVLALAASDAWADHDDDHHDRPGRGNREHSRQPVRRPEHRPRYEYPYAQPIYVPQPVYEEPRQSPGISLFLPFDLRR